MRHLEILVEEPSVEAALNNLVPKIIDDRATFAVYVHGGKADLLSKLPGRLRGYGAWLPNDFRIIVLLDEDREDCNNLKAELELAAKNAGLVTKSSAGASPNFQVLNRVAIEELEAWFFGDAQAIAQAYPGVPSSLASKAGFRDPDAIGGGTSEALERVLQKAGHHRGGLAKIAAARTISAFMVPARNTSRSFRVFRDGLVAAVS